MTTPYPTIRLKVSQAPQLKCRVTPVFPANVVGQSGVAVTKANGTYTLSLALGDFGSVSSIPDPSISAVPFYDSITGATNLISYDNLATELAAGIGDYINVKAPPYLAIGNGVVDDTVSIAAAIAAAPDGATVFFPAGTYKVSGSGSAIFSCTNNKTIHFLGVGVGSKIVVPGTVGNTTDLFSIAPTLGTAGWGFANLWLSLTGGRHGIIIDTTDAGNAAQAYNFRIENMRIWGGAGYSIYGKNSATNTTGGFEYSSIKDCNLTNGIRLERTGDSITIAENVMSGTGASIYASQIIGAGNLQILHNNLSNSGGTIIIEGGVSPIIDGNELEQAAANTEANSAMIDLIGSVSTLWNPKVINNQIQVIAGNTATPIRVDAATNTTIENNRVSVPSAHAHVVVTSSASDTFIAEDNQWVTNNVIGALSITDSGTRTFFGQKFIGTSGGVPYYSDTKTLSSSALLNTNGVVCGGGAGAAPFTSNIGVNGQVLIAKTGVPPVFSTVTSDISIGTPDGSNNSAWTVTPTTGSGNFVKATSPTLVTPVLDTPTFSGTVAGANTIPLSILAQSSAYSLVGNTTSGAANNTAFTIGGLTLKASPAATDIVLLQDEAASHALKYTTVSALASAGSVGSVNTLTGSLTLATSGGSTVVSSGTTITIAAPGGLLNKFRNGTMDVWQRGTSALASAATTVNGYQADGWITNNTFSSGAGPVMAQAAGRLLTVNSLQITGATNCTDVIVKQRIESYMAAPLTSQVVTVQAWVRNDTGGSITPTLTVKHPTVIDTFGTMTTDVSAVSLQACANTAWTQVAYTFTDAGSASLGLEVSFDFGNNFSSNAKSIKITECDIRATPGVATGLNSAPPPPELRPIAGEMTLNQRYFVQRNNISNVTCAAVSATQFFGKLFDLPATMRAAGTVATTGTFISSTASGGAGGSFSGPTGFTATVNSVHINSSATSGLAAGNASNFSSSGSTTISVSAEL